MLRPQKARLAIQTAFSDQAKYASAKASNGARCTHPVLGAATAAWDVHAEVIYDPGVECLVVRRTIDARREAARQRVRPAAEQVGGDRAPERQTPAHP